MREYGLQNSGYNYNIMSYDYLYMRVLKDGIITHKDDMRGRWRGSQAS